MNETAQQFIIYALVFRLSVLMAGTLFVFLGYRLFVLGVMPKDGSEIDAQSGEIRLTVKNAAPGTCFAAFGIIIVSIMLWQGNPQFRTAGDMTPESTPGEVLLRGNTSELNTSLNKARQLEERGDLDAAIRSYAEILSNPSLMLRDTTDALGGIASAYLKQERFDEAVAYARLASQVRPRDADLIALVARIEHGRGNRSDAVAAMRQAAQIDHRFHSELEKLNKQH